MRVALRQWPATVVLLMLWCVPVSAQPASGAVGAVGGHTIDAKSGVVVQKVLVTDLGTGRFVRTDELGRFDLVELPAGPRKLIVSIVGYALVQRDVDVPAGRTLEIVIPLSEGTGTYTTSVTVTADLFRPSESTVAAQQTLGSADIQNLRGVLADDPLRAVQVLPGVATGDDFRSEFSVRGSSFSHMNLTVDGFSTPYLLHTVRAVEDASTSGSVAMINSDVLEDVTLLNGGYAQKYGDRTGAEVDFRLREGSRERRQAHVAVSGTSASLVWEGPIGGARRGSWLVSARQSYLDLVVERLAQGEGISFSFADGQGKLAYDITPSQRVELTVLAGRSTLEEQRQDTEGEDFFIGRNASAIAVGAWRLVRPRVLLTARGLAAVNEFSNDTTDDVRLDKGADRQGAGRLDGSVVVTRGLGLDVGAQAEWTGQSRQRQRLSQGQYRVINDFSGDAVRSGGYGLLRWTTGPLTLSPGVRADHFSLTGETTASPWLQGEWKIGHAVALRGGAGVYRQFPDFEQVIGSLAFPGARAQRATQYDLGLEQRVGSTFRWQVTLYDREEVDFFRRPGADTRLVNGRVVRGTTSAVYQQGLEGYARGVEFLVQRKTANGLSGWFSYSYGRARNTDPQTGETYWGDLDQRHTLNVYTFYRKSDRTSLSVKFRAGSNTPAPGYYRAQGSGYFVATSRNDVRLPMYSRVDVRANRTYRWSQKRLTLFVEVMNVLNRDNVRYNPPGVNTRTGQVSRLFESLIPIVPSAGILIEF